MLYRTIKNIIKFKQLRVFSCKELSLAFPNSSLFCLRAVIEIKAVSAVMLHMRIMYVLQGGGNFIIQRGEQHRIVRSQLER